MVVTIKTSRTVTNQRTVEQTGFDAIVFKDMRSHANLLEFYTATQKILLWATYNSIYTVKYC